MEAWTTLIAGPRQIAAHYGQGATLRLLSTWELMEARREALAEGGTALWGNACLLARALERDGRPVFATGRQVLEGLTVADIDALCQRWGAFAAAANPSPLDGDNRVLALKESMAQSSYGRLQWRVLRSFGALPTEERARRMTHRDFLWCGLNLMLDDQAALDALCPSCRSQVEAGRCPSCGCATGDGVGNANFDLERFEALKTGQPGT